MTDRRERTDDLLESVQKDAEAVLGPQGTGRWAQTKPEAHEPAPGPLKALPPTVTLRCLSLEDALRVITEFPNRERGGASNTMTMDGASVHITYADKMWPYDIASWAGEQGLASDSDASRTIGQL